MTKHSRLLLLVLCLPPASAAASETVSFNRDIRPLLSDNCFQCHGPDENKREAGLRLDVREEAVAQRDAGPAISPGQPAASELIKRINHDDPEMRMPPADSERALTPEQRHLLENWIAQGAVYEQHWAFITPERPALPAVPDEDWPRNAIDNFVLSRLQLEGLRPSPPASRERLIRRLSFDLTGLPPTLESIDAFLADDSPDAVEKVIDQLLASESYGEHMATGWLDAARYADTNGYNNDTQRYNWRWRDWVIQAFNRNLPFDQFVIEQLAGDLLPEATLDQQLATGFNRNHSVTSEGGIIDEEYRLEYVADRVHTTSMVFMALSMQCARCHDHKFDPISQREYYAFFAFFNQVPETGYHKEHVGNPNPVIPAPTPQQNAAIEKLTLELKTLDGEARDQKQKALEELQKIIPTAMVMRDQEAARETFMLLRGDYDKPGAKVEPDVPAAFPPLPEGAPRNRLGLAQWLTSREHPLTTRVMVNRLWYQMFGQGIVETVEDFGSQGAWPSHPDLLDWLAIEFAEGGWDVKELLKRIAMSATYQQSPRTTAELLQRDPQNRLLARGPRFRLSAEMLRDQALTASGLLHSQIGGPSVKPYQPAGLWEEIIVGSEAYSGGGYKQDQGTDLYRRSVYTYWKRTCPPPALNLFDAPEREFCTVRRSRTNTPLQALVLLNDPTFVEAARVLAERAMNEGGDTLESRATFAFRRVISRAPTPQELEVLLRVYGDQQARFVAAPDQAAELLAIGESKPDSSLSPADLAAWTTIASMILNLDEAINR
ncbi:MAG: PSD1 and planctomycete cytochrome C domain-containing protein [Planctomycetota bacterium]